MAASIIMGVGGGLAWADRIMSGMYRSHMLNETQGIKTRKTDPLPDLSKASHSEPEADQRAHYAGRSFRPRPRPQQPPESIAKQSFQPEEKTTTFQPTSGPQPPESTGTQPQQPETEPETQQSETQQPETQQPETPESIAGQSFQPEPQQPEPQQPETQPTTGVHGSAGSLRDHPHTFGNRPPEDTNKDITAQFKSKEDITPRPRISPLVAIETVKKLKKTKISGLPEVSSNNVNLVRLARASYIREQNKYNYVF